MSSRMFSFRHVCIFFWFTVSLAVMTGIIFFDGYAGVHADETIVPELVFEYQTDIIHPIVSVVWPSLPVWTPQLDFVSDDSFQKYLSNETPFADINYVPADLASINSNFTANNVKKFKLREEAWVQFADMAWHFWNSFSGDKLYVLSAYRSSTFQDELLKRWYSISRCAKWWTSEHQAGLAVDLRVVTKWGKMISLDHPSKYTEWLHANAHQRGFHNTYQKGIEIDGKIAEGWHRRYMQEELATLLYEKWMTIAEYYKWIMNNE